MSPFDRQVRAQIYRHIVASGLGPAATQLANARGWAPEEVEEAMRRLEHEHRIALVPDEPSVWMAHPFSGVDTEYRSTSNGRSWYANCAWDSLAILSLMGDGQAVVTRENDEVIWDVRNGVVTPGGVIHVQVPARHFWDDVGFT